jgi:hypothetical protein
VSGATAPAPVQCKPDCLYWSKFTETCDYSLTVGHSRGCPRDACIRYEPKKGHRRHEIDAFEPGGMYYEPKGDRFHARSRAED